MWNVDTPAPPAGSTPPTGNDTMNKERTTAASPTVPLEKTPAAELPTPPEGRAFSKPRGWWKLVISGAFASEIERFFYRWSFA
jgi:hypothetical protein